MAVVTHASTYTFGYGSSVTTSTQTITLVPGTNRLAVAFQAIAVLSGITTTEITIGGVAMSGITFGAPASPRWYISTLPISDGSSGDLSLSVNRKGGFTDTCVGVLLMLSGATTSGFSSISTAIASGSTFVGMNSLVAPPSVNSDLVVNFMLNGWGYGKTHTQRGEGTVITAASNITAGLGTNGGGIPNLSVATTQLDSSCSFLWEMDATSIITNLVRQVVVIVSAGADPVVASGTTGEGWVEVPVRPWLTGNSGLWVRNSLR